MNKNVNLPANNKLKWNSIAILKKKTLIENGGGTKAVVMLGVENSKGQAPIWIF